MDLIDKQWALLEPFFRPRSRPDGRGRPFRDARAVLNGVLWVLRTGAPWHDLPTRYPPYQTCHRRFQQWQRSGRLDRLLQALAEDLEPEGFHSSLLPGLAGISPPSCRCWPGARQAWQPGVRRPPTAG